MKLYSIIFLMILSPAFAYEGNIPFKTSPAPATPEKAFPADKVMVTPEEFKLWLNQEMRPEVKKHGIKDAVIDNAFKDIKLNKKIIELDNRQPEFTSSPSDYLKKVLSTKRKKIGRKKLSENRVILSKIKKKYGVQPQYIVALWGIETYYGSYTGSFKVIEALANLAHDGRRAEFFKKELIKALQIVQDGHISSSKMYGSWAGAMGQNQFMPSTFLAYAVDYNNDRKKDIWNDKQDIFASMANYLNTLGWKGDERWGRKVSVPKSINLDEIGLKHSKTVTKWNDLGVRKINGSPLPKSDIKASLLLPEGFSGPAYLVYDNFRALLKWNRSIPFALSVGLLANSLY